MLFRSASYLSWFLFGFYLYGVLVLVVIFMTSQGLSKTDFVRKTYCVFGGENLTGSSLRKFPHLPCVDSPCCYLSNKIGFTSFGVRLQKLWGLWFCCLAVEAARRLRGLRTGDSGVKTPEYPDTCQPETPPFSPWLSLFFAVARSGVRPE